MEAAEKMLLVHKYLSNELDEQEKFEFEDSLRKNQDLKDLHDQIKSIWEAPVPPIKSFNKEKAYKKHLAAILNEEATSSISSPSSNNLKVVTEQDSKAHVNTTTKVFSIRRLSMAVAAAFVLGAAAWFVFRTNDSNTIINTIDANKEAQFASLEDGTQVKLNQGAILDIYKEGDTRKVRLSGEAYFEVVKNKDKAFIIETDNASITVLGTSFVVSTIDKFVSVKEGIVEVNVKGSNHKVEANQKLSFKNTDVEVSNIDFNTSNSWLGDDLKFTNDPFDKVVEKLGNHFKVKLILPQTRDWNTCTFTSGSLKDASLEEVLLILQLTYQLEYVKTSDDSYKLTKVKCK
jgi:ferric-dicitrate binding protein FerR (iron transport regulator)